MAPVQLQTVPAQTPYVQYLASSLQTVFPYPFEITQDSDLVVVLNGVTQPVDGGYTVSGQGNSTGGNVTFTSGLTAGTVVTLFRNIIVQRVSQIAQGGGFASATFNYEFNQIYLILQDLVANIAQCLQIPNTNNPAPTTIFTPAAYANKYLSFDSNGNPTPAALTVNGTVNAALIQSFLTQTMLGTVLYSAQTPTEAALSITPVNVFYPPGYVDRYATNTTPGTTDMTTAITNAIAVVGASGANCGKVIFLANTYLITSTLVLPNGVQLQGAGGNAGLAGSAIGTNIYVNSNITAIQYGNSFSGTTEFCGTRDLSITFGASAGGSGTIGIFHKCATYCMTQNVFMFTASAISYTGIVFSGGSGTGCFGNTVIGGFIQNCHVGVQFTNTGGTLTTSQTIVGLNILGRAADTTAIMYLFSNVNEGLQSSITGGFIQNYNIGFQFNTTKGVVISGVYFNGATLGSNPVDLAWSAAAADVGVTVIASDLATGLTSNLTNNAVPVGCQVIGGGNVNGVRLTTGLNDVTAVGAGIGALSSVSATSLKAVAIGESALAALTTGTQNTAVGYQSLQAPTTQANNTAVGASSLSNASNTGAGNTAVGTSAGNGTTSGGNNVAVGINAQAGTTSSNNVAVGQSSSAGTTGSGANTAVGSTASAGTTGTDNTAIGSGAIIGTVAGTATSSNQVLIGDASVVTLYCKQTTITTTSDIRDKTNIAKVKHGLQFVLDLNPVEWTWAHRADLPSKLDGTAEQGFVAQHLQEVVAKHSAQSLRLVDESNPDRLGATPGRLLPVMVNAIQELSAQVTALQAEVAALKAK